MSKHVCGKQGFMRGGPEAMYDVCPGCVQNALVEHKPISLASRIAEDLQKPLKGLLQPIFPVMDLKRAIEWA